MPASVIGYEASNSIVELSTTELDNLSYYVLEYMINSGDFAGTLTANTSSTGNLIGTFVDTARAGNIGDSNITIVSNNTNLYQSNTQIFTTVPAFMTVGLNTSVTGTVVLEENKTTLSALGQEIFDRYMSNGPGTYYLGVTAPGDSGTWGYDYFIDDTLYNFTIQNERYYLWKKLEQNYAATHIEPLKLSSNVLTRFSDTEIKQLAYYVENIFLTTGIGQYALQTSPPATGSWVNQGTITDIRRQETTEDFNGPAYAGDYISTYEGIREIPYASPASTFSAFIGFGSFINPDQDAITYQTIYSGSWAAEFAGSFTGPGGSYTVAYINVSIYSASFAGPTSYTAPSYAASNYSETITVNYLGPDLIAYEGSVEYDGVLVAETDYSGFAGASYTGPGGGFLRYTAASYTAEYIVPYAADYDNVFAGGYDLGTNPYVAEFITTTPETFEGTTFTSAFTNFINPDEIAFNITYVGNFVGTFAGYSRNYVEDAGGTASYLGPGPAYIGVQLYTASFTGSYEGNFASSYIATYTGEYDVSYTAEFTSTFVDNYIVSYETTDLAPYLGTQPSVYTGDTTIDYIGITPGFATYSSLYEGPSAIEYVALYTGPSFTGFDSAFISEFQEPYTGPAVSGTTETITTLTLWRRVA